jgi:prevent-host-death family protein
MQIDLREARRHFSRLTKAVKAGREVVLTERGKPIAVVKPLRKAATAEGILKRLEATGLLRPAAKRTPMPPVKPIRLKGGSIIKTLRADRDLR